MTVERQALRFVRVHQHRNVSIRPKTRRYFGRLRT